MKTCIVLLTGLILFGAAAFGQSTAQINGTIKDASGGAVPGAEVKATQTATGVSRTATSGPNGAYILPNLPIGPYRVEVSKESRGGFERGLQPRGAV